VVDERMGNYERPKTLMTPAEREAGRIFAQAEAKKLSAIMREHKRPFMKIESA
jgi:hypothetical protein